MINIGTAWNIFMKIERNDIFSIFSLLIDFLKIISSSSLFWWIETQLMFSLPLNLLILHSAQLPVSLINSDNLSVYTLGF